MNTFNPEYDIIYNKKEQEQQTSRMRALGINTDGITFEQGVNTLLALLEKSSFKESATIISIIQEEYDASREQRSKYEGTPNEPKFNHKCIVLRDLLNRIKSK